MRKIILAASTVLLLSAPALAEPPSPLFNWTGFYVGGQAGYGFGKSFQCFNCNSGGGSTDKYTIDGATGGVAVGYNWQFAPHWLIGVETDFSFSNIGGGGQSAPGYSCGTGSDPCKTEVDNFGTVRGRIGFTTGNLLLYGTGGWAYGRAFARVVSCISPVCQGSRDLSGWTAGGGVEYAFSPNWTARVEYLRVDLGQFVFDNVTTGCTGIHCSSDARFNVVRAGLSYKFGSQ